MSKSTTKNVKVHGLNFKLVTFKNKSGSYTTNIFKEGDFCSRAEVTSKFKKDSIQLSIVKIECNDYSKFTR